MSGKGGGGSRDGTSLVIGAYVTIKTTTGEEMKGEIFCYDIEKSNSVILRTELSKGHYAYRWLKTNIIRDVENVHPPSTNPLDEKLPAQDFAEILRRCKLAEEKARKAAEFIGVDVTERAQQIFDSLKRTMPVKWDKKDMVVFGVRIAPPYGPEQCTGGDSDQSLDRVKKVLIGETKRLNAAKEATTAAKAI